MRFSANGAGAISRPGIFALVALKTVKRFEERMPMAWLFCRPLISE
jgi:hypothetical protein